MFLFSPLTASNGQTTETKTASPRFPEYFKALEVAPFSVLGSSESKAMKSIRPFLLPNELVASSVNGKNLGNKGKKSKKSHNKGKMKDLALVYTFANPPPKPMSFTSSNIEYRITQQVAVVTLFTASGSLNTFTATAYTVNALDQIASLGNVFDQYRIDEIEVWFEPQGANSSTGITGTFYSVIDYDDATALTTIGAAADYTNCLSSLITESHYRRFKPHIAVAAYSGTFVSFSNEEAGWIDIASPSVQHYGVKTACTVSNTAVVFTQRLRYHVSFRNIR